MKIFLKVIFALFKRIGTSRIKKALWDKEFADSKWNYLDPENSKVGRKDIVYDYVEQYSGNGNILDLGCGTGRIGRELNINKYAKYIGVDVSEVAINKARGKCEQEGERMVKNEFYVSDILQYSPPTKYDVILFQESLQYFNKYQIRKALRKYAQYLNEQGVIIIRLYDRHEYSWIIKIVEQEHQIVDRYWPENKKTAVIVLK